MAPRYNFVRLQCDSVSGGSQGLPMSLAQEQRKALIAQNSGNRTGDNGGNRGDGPLFAPVQMH
ncbi:MAG: hypothetical protein ACKVHO_23435, partial [Verrucomicrobiia bacterium]